MQTLNTHLDIVTALKRLNTSQKNALKAPFPFLVNGPAGSGKSVVLIAKVLNIVDPAKFTAWSTGQVEEQVREQGEFGLQNTNPQNILITTYNDGVLEKNIKKPIEDCLAFGIPAGTAPTFSPTHTSNKYSDHYTLTHNNYTIYLVRFNHLVGALSPMTGYDARNSGQPIIKGAFDTAYASASPPPPPPPSLTTDAEKYDEYITEYNLTFWGCLDRFFNVELERRGMVTSLGTAERKLRKATLNGATDSLKTPTPPTPPTYLYPSGLKVEWLSQIGESDAVLAFAEMLNPGIPPLPTPINLTTPPPATNPTLFDYIFVDEFQDMTRADFCLFYHLLKNNKGARNWNFGFFGDITQAVQLGVGLAADVTAIPSSLTSVTRISRTIKALDESYRLPANYIRSLIPLYDKISPRTGSLSKAVLKPVKHALPGARLMFVYAHGSGETWEAAIAMKLKKILRTYSVYDRAPNQWGTRNDTYPNTMIMEEDNGLQEALQEALSKARTVGGATTATPKIETSTILVEKGLEFDCVIWSARQPVNRGRHIWENVYTILTRSTCLGIIVWADEADCNENNRDTSPLGKCKQDYRDIIKCLKGEDHDVIFFDTESENKFDAF